MKFSGAVLLALMLVAHGAFAEKLMIVMLDGFRWDYLDRIDKEDIPNFTAFLDSGSRPEYVQTIFPSLSWASWTTIVTGT